MFTSQRKVFITQRDAERTINLSNELIEEERKVKY